jgi:hypothetical protein
LHNALFIIQFGCGVACVYLFSHALFWSLIDVIYMPNARWTGINGQLQRRLRAYGEQSVAALTVAEQAALIASLDTVSGLLGRSLPARR